MEDNSGRIRELLRLPIKIQSEYYDLKAVALEVANLLGFNNFKEFINDNPSSQSASRYFELISREVKLTVYSDLSWGEDETTVVQVELQGRGVYEVKAGKLVHPSSVYDISNHYFDAKKAKQALDYFYGLYQDHKEPFPIDFDSHGIKVTHEEEE